MPGRRKHDHINSFAFRVEIDGVQAGAFRACSGLKVESEIFEYAEGGDNAQTRKLIGPTKCGNITLRKGVIVNDALWSWRDEITTANGKVKRRSGSIVICDDNGSEIGRWNFHNAWPVRWEGPEFDAKSAELACECLELAPERLEKKK